MTNITTPAQQLSDYLLAIQMPLVDAILFLQPSIGSEARGLLPPPTGQSQLCCRAPRPMKQAIDSATHAADKLFPVMLLKCPRLAFASFTKTYNIHPNIVKAISDARRRKINRKCKRVSRCSYAQAVHSTTDHESDTEGDCAIIDEAAVFAQLMATSEAIKFDV